jgi:hypothetical protein
MQIFYALKSFDLHIQHFSNHVHVTHLNIYNIQVLTDPSEGQLNNKPFFFLYIDKPNMTRHELEPNSLPPLVPAD